MPGPEVSALLGVLVVSAVSLVGAATFVLPALRRHGILLVMVAFAAGTLLGDAFFHLLPEAVESQSGFTMEVTILVLGGFLAFFLLEGALRWGHAHGEEAHPHLAHEAGAPTHPHPSEARAVVPPPGTAGGRIAPFAWTNLVGDGLHNLVDGALIAAAFYVSPVAGLATTIAVAAHEVPQELGDFAVLLRAGLRPRRALSYNLLSAFLAVAGALAVIGLSALAPTAEAFSATAERFALPLIAGGFVYIAAADLVPELHHHTEGKFVPMVLVSLIAGVALMAALLGLE